MGKDLVGTLSQRTGHKEGERLTIVRLLPGLRLSTVAAGALAQRVKSPHLADLIPAAIRPHGEWVGTRLNVFALAYNTRLVRKQDLPKSYEDLAHPRWKGKLGIEADDADWLAGVFAQLGEARGVRVFREIVAANGISVRRGHTLLTQLVVSGEVPLALTLVDPKAMLDDHDKWTKLYEDLFLRQK